MRLALDTAATKTLVIPDVLDDLGYAARDGVGITVIRTANHDPEPGYLLRVQRFFALGFGFSNFEIHAHDLPDYGIDGLLGMNFLENFDFAVRSVLRKIYLEHVSSPLAA
ncbi:MAG TPA: aspartyl protease family protein [Kofleriaceae bacterium]|nr:aspartyl protease family protein [Kofleriaceae bacterium]